MKNAIGRLSATASGLSLAVLVLAGTPSASADPRGPALSQPGGSSVTFTQVSGSPNPTSVGGPFVVTALECDRVVNVQATGTMVFKDTTTGVALGSASLGSSIYANCGQAQVTDSEALAAGTYSVEAKYVPSGADPVAKSHGSYEEDVKALAFTKISWTTGAPIPDPHFEGTVARVGKAMYDIGGSTADCSDGEGCSPQLNVDVYHPKTNTWTEATALPDAHEGMPVSAAVGGNIFVIGGDSGQNQVDEYSPVSNTWTTLPGSSDIPASINSAWSCGAAVGSNVYVFTEEGIGILDTGASPPSWTVLAAQPLLTPGEGGSSLFCSATRLGPNDPTSTKAELVITGPGDGSADSLSARVLEFSPATDSLTEASAATAPMAEHSSVTIDGNVVVAGGDFGAQTVQALPPGLSEVKTLSNLPQPRDDAGGGVVYKGKWYITGGGEGGGTPSGGADVLIGTPH